MTARRRAESSTVDLVILFLPHLESLLFVLFASVLSFSHLAAFFYPCLSLLCFSSFSLLLLLLLTLNTIATPSLSLLLSLSLSLSVHKMPRPVSLQNAARRICCSDILSLSLFK